MRDITFVVVSKPSEVVMIASRVADEKEGVLKGTEPRGAYKAGKCSGYARRKAELRRGAGGRETRWWW